MTSPLVSVVVVCFNHARFVTQCLDTVCAQDYPDLEIFVVDNGSTDESREVIRRHPAAGRFELVTNENIGLVRALNALRHRLRGTYYCFVAADDYWCPDKVGRQVALLATDARIGACSGLVTVVDGAGRTLREPAAAPAARTDVTFERLLLSRHYFPAPVAMIRAKAIEAVGWYDPALAIDDYQLWLALAHRGWRLVCTGERLGYYRRHGSNVSRRIEYVQRECLAILERYRSEPGYARAVQMVDTLAFWQASYHDKWRALALLPTLSLNEDTVRLIARGLVALCLPRPLLARFDPEHAA